ncbi:MAG TPA: hypothetical protein VK284_09595 [Streptosporangiaceae bacterium]|nr:hypothetical protein [Streptosporangiaceae bacterium]
MFQDITPAELGQLRTKLYSAGHKFSEVAHQLGQEGLALPPLSAEHDEVWARRAPFADLMEDMYGMAEQTEGSPARLFGNPYEVARDRFERINRNRATIIAGAQATIEWAEQEWADAQGELARFESSPGIPLPQYRGGWDFAKAAMSVQIND